jgi:hypothetical protein
LHKRARCAPAKKVVAAKLKATKKLSTRRNEGADQIGLDEIINDLPISIWKPKLEGSKQAVEDAAALANMPGAPVKTLLFALFGRGIYNAATGDHASALVDFSAALALYNMPPDRIAAAAEDLAHAFGSPH